MTNRTTVESTRKFPANHPPEPPGLFQIDDQDRPASLIERARGEHRMPLRPVPSRMAKRNIARLMAQMLRFSVEIGQRVEDDPGNEWELELHDYLADELKYLRHHLEAESGFCTPAGWQGVGR